jgi:Reverse transcriptase (RNA-dependent DNA polymerase)
MFYTNSLPTTASNATDFTRREVQRSTLARRFQASLGFPPDDKFITALNVGTFLNCDILPADVTRATIIWGPSTAALKGRTTCQRPLPPPQAPLTSRAFDDQHMHCDLMFVNKQPFLVSITHPVGLILVSSVDQVSAPVLRQAMRRMFGTLGAKGIRVTQFTSDNERGITALFGDMNAIGVSVVAVGPGQHAHTIERAIRTLKETILRSIMNVVEKYHPTLDDKGDRIFDKVKARLCVDGRAQERDRYLPEEIESPTASISAIFTIAQIAAVEERFVMIGDVGSAYLNAVMPTDNPDKILYISIEPDVASEIIRQDATFAPFQRANGTLVVQLNKALYGCIESAKLWYQEIAGTLTRHGFTANSTDICIFNKMVRGTQITIAVYVDGLMMTSTDKKLILEME